MPITDFMHRQMAMIGYLTNRHLGCAFGMERFGGKACILDLTFPNLAACKSGLGKSWSSTLDPLHHQALTPQMAKVWESLLIDLRN